MFNKTEIFRTAHDLARREMASFAGRRCYGTYAICFADQVKAVYASIRAEAVQERNHPGLVRGFQVIEPDRVWA